MMEAAEGDVFGFFGSPAEDDNAWENLSYDWEGPVGFLGPLATAAFLLVVASAEAAVGFAFGCLAARRLRRRSL